MLGFFFKGLLFVAPLGITIFILYSTFDWVDSLVRIRFEGKSPNDQFFIPGVGFLIVVFSTMMIGFVFTVLLPQTLQNYIERGIKKMPLVKVFYSAFKDLLSAFVGEKRKFDKAVLVTINKESNIKKIGFITQDDLNYNDLKDMVSVYFPHSYAFSGELFVVPKDQVEYLDIPPADVMKIIISGGVSST